MERPSRRKIIKAGTAVAVASTMLAIIVTSESNRPQNVFTQYYTEEDGCLEGTSYDPDQGADIWNHERDGNEELEVIPGDANFRNPALLRFQVDQSFSLVDATLTPNDAATADYLAEMQCPDAPQTS